MSVNKSRVSKEALAHLAQHLGASSPSEITVTAHQMAEVAELGEVQAVYAARADKPNTVASVAVAASSDLYSLADVTRLAGRDVFTPTFPHGRVDLPDRVKDPITIEPRTNNWVLNKCDRHSEKITVRVPIGSAPKADVYLLADTTGSMGGVIDAVKAGASAILAHPGLAGYDVAWGVGNYKDFPVLPDVNDYAFDHQLAPTTTIADADARIGTWTASQGGDGSEGQLYALHRLATDPAIGWRADAKKIIVWFGDAPAHDPICAGLTGLGVDLTEAVVTGALVTANATVVAVSTTTGFADALDHDPNVSAEDYLSAGCTPAGTAGQATRITGATGGSHTTGIDPSTIVTTLGTLIAAAVSTIGNVHLQPTGDTAEFIFGISPAGGYGPLPGDREHELTFEVEWVGTRPCMDRPQEFTGTIDVVADSTVVAQKRVRVSVPSCRYHHSVEFLCDGTSRGDDAERECQTLASTQYATLVTIYNPGPCPAEIEKRFATLVINGKPVGREPETVPAEPFAKIVLQPGEATMDDCCAIPMRDRPGALFAGVLDVIASHPLEVTVTHTTSGERPGAAGITSRSIEPRRAP